LPSSLLTELNRQLTKFPLVDVVGKNLPLMCNRTVAYLQPAYCVEATYLLQQLQPLVLFTLVTVWSNPKSEVVFGSAEVYP